MMRVFGKRVLRGIFGPKRGEVTGSRRKLHNEELHNLYSSPNRMIKSRIVRWAGHVPRNVKNNTRRISVAKPEGKGTPGRPRRKLEDNIKMDLGEVG
jgi:hypothetical protein